MDIPLRRSSKAVSLAAGLNRLQVEEDEPDGEGSSAGQSSFLHSKCKGVVQLISSPEWFLLGPF